MGGGGPRCQSIAIRRANVLRDYDNISGQIKRRRRTTGNDEINKLCYGLMTLEGSTIVRLLTHHWSTCTVIS